MLRLINRFLDLIGLELRYRSGKIIASLSPKIEPRGRVLISYIPDAILADDTDVSSAHTHYWECRYMAHCFLEHGFAVDVLHFADDVFNPSRSYDILISARTNLERLAKMMPAHCLKIAHLDTAHFLTHNANALARLLDIRDRHGVSMPSNRMVENNWALESADIGCVLGNEFTVDTYRYAGKPIHRIPLSSVRQYEWDDEKDFDSCRDTFIWFGSGGFAHKGLDLVIDAFRELPDLKLLICGPLDVEPRFVRAFNEPMFHSSNIETIGWVDVDTEDFRALMRRTLATVYPSCSEGGGGSVITCMHAGLIPVVTREASVDTEDFGLVLDIASVEAVRNAVVKLSRMPPDELERRARSAWNFARGRHTRETFAEHYDRFVEETVLPEVDRRRVSA